MSIFGKLVGALLAVALLYLGGRLLIARIQLAPADLGASGGQLRACPDMPNCVNSQSSAAKHAIAPLVFTDTPAEAQARLLTMLDDLPRAALITVEADYIHATVTSWGWGYIDDVEFLIGDGRVDVRSGARLPYYDFNMNRKRVEALRARWQALAP